VDTEKLVYSSIRGTLETLDPHSYFLDPDNFARMREDFTGKFYGLGIQITKQEDRIVILSAVEGTPAWRLGLQPGDVISHINGESTKPLSSFDAMQKLRGEKGTKVNVTIVREGLDKPLELTVIREEIPLFSVPYAFILQDGIGYIFVRNWAETTTDELEEKLTALLGQGMKALFLDLRGNTGGPLYQAVAVSDEFLPKGAKIVSVSGRNKVYDKEFFAIRDNQYEELPLIILTNQGTASASEIVAGAVMDNDRGLIVGEDTWGKGLVQTVFPLAPNMALALTTGKYYTPSGRSIQRDYTHIEDYLMNKSTPPADKREISYTLKGRKVLGQGGITPDYEVKATLKPLTGELMFRGAFFSYGRKFAGHVTPLSKMYVFPKEEKLPANNPPNKIVVGSDFVVSQEVLEDFKAYLQSLKIEFDVQKFKEAEGEIKRQIEREVASAVWTVEEGMKVFMKTDPAVLKALEVLREAKKFVESQNP
jgi:carboxyl-terminal processing protease